MQIRARLSNSGVSHELTVSTNANEQTIAIAPKAEGRGSAVNGGELLCASIATCFCNDLFREAHVYDVEVIDVSVDVRSEFGAPGMPAKSIVYSVDVTATGDEATIRNLVRHTDSVAEIHNTLRLGMPVQLDKVWVRSVGNPTAS